MWDDETQVSQIRWGAKLTTPQKPIKNQEDYLHGDKPLRVALNGANASYIHHMLTEYTANRSLRSSKDFHTIPTIHSKTAQSYSLESPTTPTQVHYKSIFF